MAALNHPSVAAGLWKLADEFERGGYIPQAIKCLEAICQSPVSFLPIVEAKSQLRVATLLFYHTDNISQAKAHLDRAQLLLKQVAGALTLKCRVQSLLSKCHQLLGATALRRQTLKKGLDLVASIAEPDESSALWMASFQMQAGGALLQEGEVQQAAAYLRAGLEQAELISAPAIELLFLGSLFHLQLSQWEDAGEMRQLMQRCDATWERLAPGDRSTHTGLRIYILVLTTSFHLRNGDWKTAIPLIETLDELLAVARAEHLAGGQQVACGRGGDGLAEGRVQQQGEAGSAAAMDTGMVGGPARSEAQAGADGEALGTGQGAQGAGGQGPQGRQGTQGAGEQGAGGAGGQGAERRSGGPGDQSGGGVDGILQARDQAQCPAPGDAQEPPMLRLGPPPLDGEWLPLPAVEVLVDLLVAAVRKPVGGGPQSTLRLAAGLARCEADLARLHIVPQSRESDLNVRTIWAAAPYLSLQFHLLEARASLDLINTNLAAAAETIFQAASLLSRFPTLLEVMFSTVHLIVGHYCHSTHCFAAAAAHFARAEALAEDPSLGVLCKALGALSLLSTHTREDQSRAAELVGPLEGQIDALGTLAEQAAVLLAQGLLHLRQGNMQQARAHFGRGLRNAHHKLSNYQLVSQFLNALGVVALRSGDPAQAAEVLKSSATLSHSVHDLHSQLVAAQCTAQMHLMQKNTAGAVEPAAQAEHLQRSLQAKIAEATNLPAHSMIIKFGLT